MMRIAFVVSGSSLAHHPWRSSQQRTRRVDQAGGTKSPQADSTMPSMKVSKPTSS